MDRIVRLAQINTKLNPVMGFDYGDDNRKGPVSRHPLLATAGVGAVGTGGLYGYGLYRQGKQINDAVSAAGKTGPKAANEALSAIKENAAQVPIVQRVAGTVREGAVGVGQGVMKSKGTVGRQLSGLWKGIRHGVPITASAKHGKLIELNKKLSGIIQFQQDDEDKNHLVRNAALLGGAGLAGAGGLYAKGAQMQGVQLKNMIPNLSKRVGADGLAPVASRIASGGKSVYKGGMSAIESLLAKLRK